MVDCGRVGPLVLEDALSDTLRSHSWIMDNAFLDFLLLLSVILKEDVIFQFARAVFFLSSTFS